VLLYKLMRAAIAARPGRTEIVIDRDHFPTDRYVAMGIAEECGMTLRWVDVDTTAGLTAEQVAGVVGEQTALVAVNHVSYRSAWLADAAAITEVAHDAGALVLLDTCHSAGVVPSELDAWGVDLAAGCTYKYLNGGPGSPAFCYVAARHLDTFTQPIQGWMGNTDPFLMGPDYVPVRGIRRFLSGTPAVVGMLAIQDMVDLLQEAGLAAVRAKSEQLTAYAVDLAEEHLATYDVEVVSPREPARRGGHITLRHPQMQKVVAILWERDVIPDYRDPGGLRVGLSPLSTSYDELERGILAVRDVLAAL
jgi:kynureninase